MVLSGGLVFLTSGLQMKPTKLSVNTMVIKAKLYLAKPLQRLFDDFSSFTWDNFSAVFFLLQII